MLTPWSTPVINLICPPETGEQTDLAETDEQLRSTRAHSALDIGRDKTVTMDRHSRTCSHGSPAAIEQPNATNDMADLEVVHLNAHAKQDETERKQGTLETQATDSEGASRPNTSTEREMSSPSRHAAITPANSAESLPTTNPTGTVSSAAAATTDDAPTSTRTVDDVSLIQPNESQTEIETARRSGQAQINRQVVVLVVLIAIGIGITVYQML